jgi:DNA-binding transcriptional regulator YiaG
MKRLTDIVSTKPKNKIQEECARSLVGQRVYKIRTDFGLSQQEFGSLLDWTVETVNRVEHGDFKESASELFSFVYNRLRGSKSS